MPRKSDPGPIPGAGPPPGDKDANGVSIDENVLPKSIVTRLAKGVLPQNTNIQKDAVLALTKGATVFINYLCATANENAVKSNKKTIMPKDVLEAISQLELDEFRPRLEAELAKFEEITSEKRAASKKAAKDKESAKGVVEDSPGKTSPAHDSPNEDGADEADTLPPAKKRKANGKATPVNGTGVVGKSKKRVVGAKVDVGNVNGEDDLADDKDDYQEDEEEEDDEEEEEEEEEIYDEDEADETQNLGVDDVVEDVDEPEPREDEALDNGYDSD